MPNGHGGFERFTLDDYIITREGEVFNKKWNRKVKPQPNSKGYLRFSLAGERVFVHRLVAQLYVPNPDNKPQVNHIDGNKLNNRADNLEWVTNQENRNHAITHGLHTKGEQCPWAKLTRGKVDFIRSNPDIDANILAKEYGVTAKYIRSLRNPKYDCWK